MLKLLPSFVVCFALLLHLEQVLFRVHESMDPVAQSLCVAHWLTLSGVLLSLPLVVLVRAHLMVLNIWQGPLQELQSRLRQPKGDSQISYSFQQGLYTGQQGSTPSVGLV